MVWKVFFGVKEEIQICAVLGELEFTAAKGLYYSIRHRILKCSKGAKWELEIGVKASLNWYLKKQKANRQTTKKKTSFYKENEGQEKYAWIGQKSLSCSLRGHWAFAHICSQVNLEIVSELQHLWLERSVLRCGWKMLLKCSELQTRDSAGKHKGRVLPGLWSMPAQLVRGEKLKLLHWRTVGFAITEKETGFWECAAICGLVQGETP